MDVSRTRGVFASWRGDVPFLERAAEAYESTIASADLAKIIATAPFEGLHRKLAAQDPMRGYTHVGLEAREYVSAIPATLLPAYLTAFLLWNMRLFEERFPVTRLHSEFRLQYADAFHRLLDRIESNALAPDLSRDAFMKELGLTRLTIIPAVAQLIYPAAGIEARTVVTSGPSGWWYVYGRCGGRAPFLEIHTHDPWVKDYFNAAGWEETYRLAALALPAFPRHRGLLGSSWFYDPQLDEISPRLSYLRESPLTGGAKLFRLGTYPDTINNATSRSATRRALYEAGKYKPVAHALVWSRKDLLSRYGV